MPKVSAVFPGQGSQYVGMGRELFEKFEASRSVYERADVTLGWKLSRLSFEGPEAELNLTARTQPAILTASMAAWAGLAEALGREADLLARIDSVAGHSLGEYTALVISGCLRFADAVSLVEKRGQFMQEAVPRDAGAMVAILGLDAGKVGEVCRESSGQGVVSPANLNSPGQVVIAGDRAAVERASEVARARGAKRVIPLAVSVPSHCALMEPACERLSRELDKVMLSDLAVPLINNTAAKRLTSPQEVRGSLVAQLKSPLLWEDSVREMIRGGTDVFLEVGPGRVLSGLIRKIDRKVEVLNVENADSLNQTIGRLKELWN